jgi:hypothetical protein
MLDSVVAYASNPDLADFDGVLDGSPAVQPGLLATVGGVQQKKVDVAQPTVLDRLLDGFAGRVVGAVGRQLGSEVYVLALQTLRIGFTGQVVCDCFSGLLLIVVHLS